MKMRQHSEAAISRIHKCPSRQTSKANGLQKEGALISIYLGFVNLAEQDINKGTNKESLKIPAVCVFLLVYETLVSNLQYS